MQATCCRSILTGETIAYRHKGRQRSDWGTLDLKAFGNDGFQIEQ
jgi:hypothetical protein